jgi:SAM-dependent methyltransferase
MLNPANQAALLRLSQLLAADGYRFTTVTPASHARVLARPRAEPAAGEPAHSTQPAPANLRDIFGWNRPFIGDALRPDLLAAMRDAGILLAATTPRQMRSALRLASLGPDLFWHAGFPTDAHDAVFFGPDTYRFARLIDDSVRHDAAPAAAPCRVLDVGCGSGAGGIVAARALMARGLDCALTLTDINPGALAMCAVNARAAGIPVTLAEGDALAAVDGEFELIISNPPYLVDAEQRAYRHGGDRLGRALSVQIAGDALKRLAPGGRLLLYTGVAMLDGADPFLAELAPLLRAAGCRWTYEEIDPDVFGEELEQPAYRQVERIAAVALVATRPESL